MANKTPNRLLWKVTIKSQQTSFNYSVPGTPITEFYYAVNSVQEVVAAHRENFPSTEIYSLTNLGSVWVPNA